MLWVLAVAGQVAWAEPVVGMDWTPLSRADLTWLEDGRSSETGVGEFDGLTRPALAPFAGVRMEHWDFLGSIGLATMRTAQSDDDGTRIQSVGGLRLGVDTQCHPGETEQVDLWVGLGAYGLIPIARDTADFYSEADAADAEFDSAQARARIGGFGARLGAGVMVPVGETVQVGGGAHLVWHGQVSFTETGQTLSSLLWIQPALRVETVLR